MLFRSQKRLDIVSNNVANAATVGYKKEGVTNQAFKEMLTVKIKDGTTPNMNQTIGSMSLGTKIGEVYTNYDQGSLRQTGNTYDLAIQGDGFFAVAYVDADGMETTKYTRAGNFIANNEGYVLDSDGNYFLGLGGYLQVPTDAGQIVIDELGGIYADGEFIDEIQLVDFENYDYIEKFGNNLYSVVDGAQMKDMGGKVAQGYLEQSNVQAVDEMVNMITITRAYEANQKVITTIDNMLEKARSEERRVGK